MEQKLKLMKDQQKQINCHVVTESLTKEWEFKGGWLSFFDFKTGEIKQNLSKNLFAVVGLNSSEIEGQINKFVETHLGRFKKTILPKQVTEINNWNLSRALYLYFICQTKRFLKANPKVVSSTGLTLDELFAKGEDYLNLLVKFFLEESNIVGFTVPQGHALFFSEIGYFQFPIDDDKALGGFSLATAVPLSPYQVMALVPRTANLKQFSEFHGIIAGFSVGLNDNASRILIPPELLVNNEPQKIIAAILNYRECAKKQIELIGEKRRLVHQMIETVVQKMA